MTDDSDRPRPRYGEYATPEEQRARIRQPDVTWALETGHASAEREETVAAPAAPVDPQAPPSRRRFFDRVVTIGLLVYGVLSVVSAIPALVDYNGYIATVFELMGAGDMPAPTVDGRPWGIAAAVVLGVGLLVTAAVSWLLLQRGRLAFWVPLVGAVVFQLIAGALVITPLMSDPALMGALLPQ